MVTDAVRSVYTRTWRRVSGDQTARRAALVVGMNADVARRFSFARKSIVGQRVALTGEDIPARALPTSGPKVAVFVGRLVTWKGTRLAVETLARPSAADWQLHVYGHGPDRGDMERWARKHGVADRVTFFGAVPRAEVLTAMARAHAMLFPSMHEAAGWVVGEASSIGIPIVCLDIGGPPLLADVNGHVVPLTGDVVGGLARALCDASDGVGTPTTRWSRENIPALTNDWYAEAMAGS
jgi:glycosyltransferase involved in cell wall biosynthesis